MPITLGKVRDRIATFTWTFAGEAMQVSYRAGAITPTALAAQQEMVGEAGVISGLEQWLVGWELLGEDGKPLEISHELLVTLPNAFLDGLYIAIMRDARPPEMRAASSGGSFSPAVK